MWRNEQWDWLWDDWDKAVRRSLTPRFTKRQWRALRTQRWLGLAAKLGVLLLPFLLMVPLLAPRADTMLRAGLVGWSSLEAVLLAVHVALSVRYAVSYGWAFHHSRPLLLNGLAASRDLKAKGLIATFLATMALLTLAVP